MEEKKDSGDKNLYKEYVSENQDLGPIIEDIHSFGSLSEKGQKAVSTAYDTVKAEVRKHFEDIKICGKYSNDQLLNEITLNEEVVDKTPLKIYNYKLIIGKKILVKGEKITSHSYKGRTTPVYYDTEYRSYGIGTETFLTGQSTERSNVEIGSQTIIEGYNTDIYTTNKRIMLLNTHVSEYPSLKTHDKIEVSYTADDSFRVFSIPTRDIHSISINMNNMVSESLIIDKVFMSFLFVIGTLVGLLGFMIGINERNFMIILIALISAIIIFAIAAYLKSYKIGKPEMRSSKIASVILSVLEPFYRDRAILVLNLNTDIHNLQEIVGWVKKLQQCCKNVVN